MELCGSVWALWRCRSTRMKAKGEKEREEYKNTITAQVLVYMHDNKNKQ